MYRNVRYLILSINRRTESCSIFCNSDKGLALIETKKLIFTGASKNYDSKIPESDV